MSRRPDRAFYIIGASFVLYFIGRHYSGKVNVSKDNQGLY
jgi:hypothetical protein